MIEFTDYVVPNQALNDGDLNANSFQHQPYLDNQIKDRGFELVSVQDHHHPDGRRFQGELKSLDDLPQGAKVAIPNDPTNGGRALLLLQDKGLIKLADGTGLSPTPLDVTENAGLNSRTRRRAIAARAGRCRYRGDQHQLRGASGRAEPERTPSPSNADSP